MKGKGSPKAFAGKNGAKGGGIVGRKGASTMTPMSNMVKKGCK